MIYFIRHAESIWNAAQMQIQTKVGIPHFDTQEYLSAKFDKKFLDVGITEKGIYQCLKAKKQMEDKDIDIILVTPLKRALQTCAIMFDGHRSNAPVIVEPAFRQLIESACDIGSDLVNSMKIYPFNFDKIKDPYTWFVATLNEEIRQRIEPQLEGLQGEARRDKAVDQLIKYQKENWFGRRQSPENDEKFKVKILPNIQQQKQIIRSYSKKYSRIAIVAHSQCILRWLGHKIENCQIEVYDASKI